jgi:hypothetical protein
MYALKQLIKLVIYFLLFIIAVFIIIRAFSGNGYELATEKLSSFKKAEHEIIFNSCKDLINNFSPATLSNEFEDHVLLLGSEIPQELVFSDPEYVRYNENVCFVFLYKVPGKGVGYSVNKQNSEQFKLQWFNDFQSWERHDILM